MAERRRRSDNPTPSSDKGVKVPPGTPDNDVSTTVRGKTKRNGGVRREVAILMFILLAAIPTFSIYLGYAIGNALMPPRRDFGDREVVVDIGRLNYSLYNTHNLTIHFQGGLGNQMFQYAALYGIAKANGMKPLVGLDNRVLDSFPGVIQASHVVTTPVDTKARQYSRFVEMKPNTFDGRTFSLNFAKNIVMEGFFQSWRYFDHVRADVRKIFSFRPEVQRKIDQTLTEVFGEYKERRLLDKVPDRPVQFVGIHIRRGDMLEGYNVQKGYTVADTKFLRKAMNYFEETYKNVIFVACSDDGQWARNNTWTPSKSSLVVFSPHFDRHPTLDLCLLSKCNHTIVTSGTFGWWGAWLGNGDVIYMKDFPKPFSTVAGTFKHSDYYPQQWIPL